MSSDRTQEVVTDVALVTVPGIIVKDTATTLVPTCSWAMVFPVIDVDCCS